MPTIIPYIINAPCWRELVARAYHNSLYNQCATHFGKLSEFDKVLSFGASRTGFYAPHTLANFQSLPKFYSSVRAAQAFMRPTLWQTFRVWQSFILRSRFAQGSLGVWACRFCFTSFTCSISWRVFNLNEQSVLRPVQLGTQCVPNWIHSIELPTKF